MVRRQQQAGIDVVSDGEFGKFRGWAFYVLDRLTASRSARSRRRAAPAAINCCPDFYAEYFPAQRLPKRGVAVCVGPIAYNGQAALQKDIAIFKAAPSDSAKISRAL